MRRFCDFLEVSGRACYYDLSSDWFYFGKLKRFLIYLIIGSYIYVISKPIRVVKISFFWVSKMLDFIFYTREVIKWGEIGGKL